MELLSVGATIAVLAAFMWLMWRKLKNSESQLGLFEVKLKALPDSHQALVQLQSTASGFLSAVEAQRARVDALQALRESTIGAQADASIATRVSLDAIQSRLEAVERRVKAQEELSTEDALQTHTKLLGEHSVALEALHESLAEVMAAPTPQPTDPLKRSQYRTEVARQCVKYGRSMSKVVAEQKIHATAKFVMLDLADNGKRDFSDSEIAVALDTAFSEG